LFFSVVRLKENYVLCFAIKTYNRLHLFSIEISFLATDVLYLKWIWICDTLFNCIVDGREWRSDVQSTSHQTIHFGLRYALISTALELIYNCIAHRISIPAYAVEQQWWQSGVPKSEKSLMSFIFKMMLVLYQSVSISGSISNIYWNASKWSSISFLHWQCPSDREFFFPRFVGLLILSPWYSVMCCWKYAYKKNIYTLN
jgi:hypothetical protein